MNSLKHERGLNALMQIVCTYFVQCMKLHYFSSEYVYRIVQDVQYLQYCTFHHKMKGWIKNQRESQRTRWLVVVVHMSTFRQFFCRLSDRLYTVVHNVHRWNWGGSCLVWFGLSRLFGLEVRGRLVYTVGLLTADSTEQYETPGVSLLSLAEQN